MSEWDLSQEAPPVTEEPSVQPPSVPTEPPEAPKPVELAPAPAVTPAAPELIQIQEPPESEAAKGNRELYERILAARNAPPAVVPVQPAIPARLRQTELEMAAGAVQIKKHAEQQALGRIARKPTPKEVAAQGTSVPAFRPGDSVPNFSKGNVNARPV